MPGKKKQTVIIDFTSQQPSNDTHMPEFEDKEYDYELQQGEKVSGFDADLQFLLTSSETSDRNKKSQKKRMSKKATPKSEGPEVSGLLTEEKKQKKNENLDQNVDLGPISAQPSTSKAGKGLKKKGSPKNEFNKITRREITSDLAAIDFLTDDETTDAHLESKTLDFDGSETSSQLNETKKSRKTKKKKATREKSQSQERKLPELLKERKSPAADDNSNKKEKRVNTKAISNLDSNNQSAQEGQPIPNASDGTEGPDTANNSSVPVKKSPKPEAKLPPQLPPSTAESQKSQKSQKTEFSRLSSSKATLVKQLPAVQPVSTIFGLSHEQIYKIKLTDVKVKTLVNVPMSKMCKNALKFVMEESEGLFMDEIKKTQFVEMCTKVALYEAPGFNEVTKRIPELLEWVPEYKPLTLQHTQTNLTVSNRQVHKNNLDYTVFSFFGHIILWANELQHTANIPTLIDRFKLGITRQDIVKSLGGYHLWDRLRRDKTINAKRWKHIQKYRQLFAFEEHQFVLILRCMNLGVPVC